MKVWVDCGLVQIFHRAIFLWFFFFLHTGGGASTLDLILHDVMMTLLVLPVMVESLLLRDVLLVPEHLADEGSLTLDRAQEVIVERVFILIKTSSSLESQCGLVRAGDCRERSRDKELR